MAGRVCVRQPIAVIVKGPIAHQGSQRPCGRQRPGKIVARIALPVAYKDVGNAAPFAARKPGHDECVGIVERRIDVKRATRDHHGHYRDALGFQFLNGLERRGKLRVEHERRTVALEFRIGRLAEDHDCGVGPCREAAVGRQLGASSCGLDGLRQTSENRGRAGEMAIVHAGALPGERPPARLTRDVVGTLTGNQQATARCQRQDAIILEQDQRLAHGVTRNLAVFGGAEELIFAGIGAVGRFARLEQSETALHTQDLRHRIVDPRHRQCPGPRPCEQIFVDRLPGVRCHVHVDPGRQRLRAAFIGAAGHLAVRIPVRDDEAPEIHAVLEHTGNQRLVAGHLLALPAGEADHDGGDTFCDGGTIGQPVNIAQFLFGDRTVALVDPVICPAIGEEMLGRGDDVGTGQQIIVAWRAL